MRYKVDRGVGAEVAGRSQRRRGTQATEEGSAHHGRGPHLGVGPHHPGPRVPCGLFDCGGVLG